MRSDSRARLMISWRIIWMRVSSSAVTDCLTNASDTCCRSMSTDDVARYRSGSHRAKLTATAAMTRNTTIPSHLRRRQMASTSSVPDCDSACV